MIPPLAAPAAAEAVTAAAEAVPPIDDAADPGLADLWESTAAVEKTATTPAPAATSAVTVVPAREPSQRRRLVASVVGGTATAVLLGVALVSLGSGNDRPTVLDPALELPALDVDDEEPEVRSLGPVPPPIATDTTDESTSTTDSTSTTVPETTSTVPDSTVADSTVAAPAGQLAPTTTAQPTTTTTAG